MNKCRVMCGVSRVGPRSGYNSAKGKDVRGGAKTKGRRMREMIFRLYAFHEEGTTTGWVTCLGQ